MKVAYAGVCHNHRVEYIRNIAYGKQILAVDPSKITTMARFRQPDDALLNVEFLIAYLGMIHLDRRYTVDGIFVFLLASPSNRGIREHGIQRFRIIRVYQGDPLNKPLLGGCYADIAKAQIMVVDGVAAEPVFFIMV